ncbi:HDOD domain-containing protein [Herminiimonas fonticola]|uniref:Putative nucleotidyltransferase with HDIG domain n=1 Tax=Herminiimonas fonticola TaxID=303380 RepID=A0A4R6G066_9BURK|nr:HDOD domain-containing protein [Herminiimonas fonticola]RBA22885.1 hypothetical protein Hfont_2927 [Herminiimonas fonticola]TDN87691.1 putative nucleotidyltransferase with HDIG domain [Herminiimonas fonticola]
MKLIAVTDIIKSVRDLPSLPIIVMELLTSFEQPDANLTVLAEKVSHDQALAAKTLRLANSSFYGLSRKVTTIQQAITILGFDSIRALVVAAGATENFRSVKHPTFNFETFWRHSIGVAVCSKQLARLVNENQNYAFVCGLMHDIGRLVLVTRFPSEYGAATKYRDAQDCHMLEAEKEVLGVDHALVGRLLAESWKFPALMQKAISNHHDPEPSDMGGMPSIVHAANAIVHGLDLTNSQNDLVPEISEDVWKSLNIRAVDLRRLFRDTETDFEEACQILAA